MKRMIMVILGILVVVVVVGAAVAMLRGKSNNGTSSNYGSSAQSSPTPTPAPSSASTQSAAGKVTIANMAFTPSQITVHVGDTVTWTNTDGVAHTVTDDLGNVGGPASGDINPGASYSFKFTKAGSYQYHCTIHPSMRGTIVVQ